MFLNFNFKRWLKYNQGIKNQKVNKIQIYKKTSAPHNLAAKFQL